MRVKQKKTRLCGLYKVVGLCLGVPKRLKITPRSVSDEKMCSKYYIVVHGRFKAENLGPEPNNCRVFCSLFQVNNNITRVQNTHKSGSGSILGQVYLIGWLIGK